MREREREREREGGGEREREGGREGERGREGRGGRGRERGRAPAFVMSILLYLQCRVFSFVAVTLTAINVISVKFATRVQMVFTVAKLLALAMIIITGIVFMAMGMSPLSIKSQTRCLYFQQLIFRITTGGTGNFDNAFEGSKTDVKGMALSVYSALFSYAGW